MTIQTGNNTSEMLPTILLCSIRQCYNDEMFDSPLSWWLTDDLVIYDITWHVYIDSGDLERRSSSSCFILSTRRQWSFLYSSVEHDPLSRLVARGRFIPYKNRDYHKRLPDLKIKITSFYLHYIKSSIREMDIQPNSRVIREE